MCSISIETGDPDRFRMANPGCAPGKTRNGTAHLLPVKTADLMPIRQPGESESGNPSHYVIDYQSGCVSGYIPPSSKAIFLQLTVRRLPAERMEDVEDEPEVRQEAHFALVHWIPFRAASRSDTDMYDDRGGSAMAEFERSLGRSGLQ